jgi:hypothetical protein
MRQAEARAAELERQIQEFQFQSAQRFSKYFPLPALSFPSDLYIRARADTRKRRVVFLWLVLGTCRKAMKATAPD